MLLHANIRYTSTICSRHFFVVVLFFGFFIKKSGVHKSSHIKHIVHDVNQQLQYTSEQGLMGIESV